MTLPRTGSSVFACPSCAREIYRILSTSLAPIRGASGRATLPFLLPAKQHSAPHSTFAGIQQGHHRKLLSKAIKAYAKGKQLPWSPKRQRDGPKKWEIKSMRARQANKKHLDLPMKPGEEEIDKELLALRYTTDPLRIANIVQRGLREGKRDHVLEISRLATTGGIKSVVSWNNIIDYDMEQGNPKIAFKLYREMKERGCRPDSHTYTIVLRGLGRNAHKSSKSFDVVEKAMTVYDHLIAKTSKVKLLNIHTNSLLYVCAKAHNMDALWKVAGGFEEEGTRAPDAMTYTTILKALSESGEVVANEKRMDADGEPAEGSDRNPRIDNQISKEVLTDAEGVWLDVMSRWYRGDLKVDEALVSMMARLFLRSPEKSDWEKVMKLVEETMGISVDGARVVGQEGQTPVDPGDSRLSYSSATPPQHIAPGPRILSMLLNACAQLRLKKSADRYWNILTQEKGVQPDVGNFMDYLRILRHNRSSTEVSNLLTNMKEDPRTRHMNGLWAPGLFSLAISTCKRDIWNRSSFHNATVIMDIMKELAPPGSTSKQPSPSVLQSYLELGIGPQSDSINVDRSDQSPSRQPRPNLSTSSKNLLQALERILPYFDDLPVSVRISMARDAVGACDRIISHTNASQLDAAVLQGLKETKRVVSDIERKANATAHKEHSGDETEKVNSRESIETEDSKKLHSFGAKHFLGGEKGDLRPEIEV